MEKLIPPFTKENIILFDKYQSSGLFHPYTCVNCKPGILKMKETGLYCPDCDYTQTLVSLPTEDIIDSQAKTIQDFFNLK